MSAAVSDISPEQMDAVRRLLRIRAIEDPETVSGCVKVSVLPPTAFKGHSRLHGLTALYWVERVAQEPQPVAAVQVRFPGKDGLHTIEFYREPGARLAAVFQHKGDIVTLRHIFADLSAQGAEDTPVGKAPDAHLPSLADVLIDQLAAGHGWGQQGGQCPSPHGIEPTLGLECPRQSQQMPGCGSHQGTQQADQHDIHAAESAPPATSPQS